MRFTYHYILSTMPHQDAIIFFAHGMVVPYNTSVRYHTIPPAASLLRQRWRGRTITITITKQRMLTLTVRHSAIRRAGLRLADRAVFCPSRGVLRPSSRCFSTQTILPPILSPPSPPRPLSPIEQKSLMGKVINRYSVQRSQERIRLAESFFQAATRQAADPYVLLIVSLIRL